MADTRDDDGRRHRAIELHRKGVAFGVISERLGYSRSWLAKWLRRYREAGCAGLRPRSRAPQRQWYRTPERVVARILAIRETLEQQKTRRARFAGVGPRSSSSSCDTNACGRCRRSARSSASSGGTAIPSAGPAAVRAAANPTRHLEPGGPAICSRPTWWGRATCGAPRGSPASIRCIPWPSWAGASRPPRGATRPPNCCARILCTRGAGLGLLGSRRWITRWPRPAEADTPIASRWSCACICSWASISSSSRRGNRGATPNREFQRSLARAGALPSLSRSSGSPTHRPGIPALLPFR